jgi:hypothetical protein
MVRVLMMLMPWVLMRLDELIDYLKRRNAVKRCGGFSGRNIECDEEV